MNKFLKSNDLMYMVSIVNNTILYTSHLLRADLKYYHHYTQKKLTMRGHRCISQLNYGNYIKSKYIIFICHSYRNKTGIKRIHLFYYEDMPSNSS